MSRNTALNELIERLKHEASQIEHIVQQQTSARDRAQELLDQEQGRLLGKRELIEYLERSQEAMIEPEWKVGDRFEWKEDGSGFIASISPDHVSVRMNAGGVVGLSYNEFNRLARKVQS